MDNKQAQYLHQVLDKAIESKVLSPQDVEALREHLPELPKQKTLTEITHDVYRAWYETLSNHWKERKLGDLETWLNDLHEQLQGLKDTPANTTAHPEFLETEADYQRAPEGTIVAMDDVSTVWIKKYGAWTSTDGDRGVTCLSLSTYLRRVLRWGWGE